MSQEAVPIIVIHVKSVLDQHQKKLDEINTTPSWQQSSMARVDDPKYAQAQQEGIFPHNFNLDDKRQDSTYINSTKNSNKDTLSSLLGSSGKKDYKMTTINEDLLESQHNSSAKKTRNNEDLKEVAEVCSPNPNFSSEFSSYSHLPGGKDLSGSLHSSRYSVRKKLRRIKNKKGNNVEYFRSTGGLNNSTSNKVLLSKNNVNYLKGNKYTFKL